MNMVEMVAENVTVEVTVPFDFTTTGVMLLSVA